MKIKTIIISEEQSTSEVLKLYVEKNDNFECCLCTSDYSKAYSFLSEVKEGLLCVDISNYQEQALNFVAKISSENPNLKIIALSSDKPDINLIVRTMRVGACNFLSIPIIESELKAVLQKIYDDINGSPVKNTKSKLISVYSGKGGVGKTSIAVNLAYELSKITKENVALIDFNFEFGDISTFLDLKPSFNISYMLNNLDKINSEFLFSAMEKYKDTSLYVLADSYNVKESERCSIKDIETFLNILRETFSYVIIDVHSGFDKSALKALELSDLVLMVMIVNLPALRNSQRCFETFDKMDFNTDKIQILVNRYMENDEISADEVETVLKKNIYWRIPNNYFTLMSAINKGLPVSEINSDSNVALNYKNLALNISDSFYRQRKNDEE